jgi:hypothetical protein
MTTRPDIADDGDLMDIVDEVLRERPPAPGEAEIQATLADPAFAPIAARAVKPYEKALSAKGRDQLLRTLAVVFLTDPRAASLLAGVRAGSAVDGSRTTLSAGAEAEDPAQRSKS